VILDVSVPERPRYLGRTPPAGDNAHSAWLGRNGLLIETHETPGGVPTLFDVSDPGSPRRLAEFRLPSAVLTAGRRAGGLSVRGFDLTDSVHDPKIVGRTAFFSWYSQGVVAADVSNPRTPRFLARFLPAPTADRETLLCPGKRCVAVWGVDTLGGLVLASDMNSGLWVLKLRR
jgi:hypothetical protein